MPQCPQCHQPIDSQAVICPHCRTPLKAYGHPGIPLHRSTKGTYLCDSCTYHADDSCNYPQRPYAQECTLYDDQEARAKEVELWQSLQRRQSLDLRTFYHRYPGVVGVGVLLVISFIITLLATRR
ncbi:MAG: zinc ribbon domain-containing protein [Coleofasciculaceae cyanobacterium SM2_1_6]|nr:zinc ribbon domain-containing protein [Coleofasciculaceae cyanobacterium SM2_1_6]